MDEELEDLPETEKEAGSCSIFLSCSYHLFPRRVLCGVPEHGVFHDAFRVGSEICW